VFSVLVVEEKRKGHTNNGTMIRRGYEAMQTSYQERTGLRHSFKQLKNSWNQLKRVYS
jgi:hypothetical protein